MEKNEEYADNAIQKEESDMKNNSNTTPVTKPDHGIDVTITMHDKALFDFMLLSSFKGFGMINWVLSVIAMIIAPIMFYQNKISLALLMLGIVVLNVVVKPLQFKYQSKLQMSQNEIFKHPIQYTIAKEGIFISQSSGEGIIEWNQIIKVYEAKKMLLLYIGKTQAFILIKEQMAVNKIEQIKRLIQNETNVKNNFR